MVSVHSLWPFQLSFVLFYLSSLVVAVPWIVTDEYAEAVVTDPYYYYSSTVVTKVVDITPTVTSLPEALSTITSVATSDHIFYESGDVTVVQELYPTGVGEPVGAYGDYYDDDYYADDNEYHSTIFKVNITYPGCSTQWTKTTAADVTPPRVVRDLLPRTAVATSTSVDSSEPFEPTTFTYDVVYVDPTQVPGSSLTAISAGNRPTAMYSGAGCNYYSNYDDDSDSNSYDDDSYDYYDYYGYYGSWFLNAYWIGISPLALTLILLLGWIGIFLIGGFIEAFVRFRRLMTGWQTRRGLPVCWSLTILPITLLLLFFFKKGYRARSQADAEILRKRWADMSLGTKLRLFFVWGFRYRYPPMLGPAPARVKTSKQPDKNPGPRLLVPSPPGSEAADSRHESMARSAPADAAQAEMAEVALPPVPEVSSSRSDDYIGRAN